MKYCQKKFQHNEQPIAAENKVIVNLGGIQSTVYLCDACYTELRTGYNRNVIVSAEVYDPFLEVNMDYKEDGLTIDQRLGRITLALQHARYKADHDSHYQEQDHVDADDLLLDAIRFLCAHTGTMEDCDYLIAAYNMINKTYSY